MKKLATKTSCKEYLKYGFKGSSQLYIQPIQNEAAIEVTCNFYNESYVETVYKHATCLDVFEANEELPGIYTLHPNSNTSFQAMCLENGWTAIQARGQFGNPGDYFLKGWDSYVQGFGELGSYLILYSS